MIVIVVYVAVSVDGDKFSFLGCYDDIFLIVSRNKELFMFAVFMIVIFYYDFCTVIISCKSSMVK